MGRKADLISLYQMFDAAYPPSSPYPGSQAVAGYIGGNTRMCGRPPSGSGSAT